MIFDMLMFLKKNDLKIAMLCCPSFFLSTRIIISCLYIHLLPGCQCYHYQEHKTNVCCLECVIHVDLFVISVVDTCVESGTFNMKYVSTMTSY